jgi:hypothetical protein
VTGQSEDERCREARKLERIDAAFKAGDLEALRAAVGDPSIVPNGPMPPAIGPCLVYAIYWSPLAFIRELLELGADPNHDDGDGFPPLHAALSKTHPHPGSMTRTDVNDVIALLLERGADPNQRGFNDYTALHKAVEERNTGAIDLLLAAGADPALKTRIDDCETPGEMARKAGLVSRLTAPT